MKPLKLKHGATTLILALCLSINAHAAQDEYSKNKHREYDVNEETVLVISNKYGNVDVTNWNRDKVSVDITVTVDHRREERARELLEDIIPEISQQENTIRAITNFDRNFSRSGGLFNFGDDTKEFKIDYEVKAPRYINLELENKYGDVFINEITGRADIAVKYGNLKANKILRDNSKPLSHVNLAYSNGNIGEVNWLKLTLKYTPNNCQIDKAKALMAVTKYSKLNVTETSSIVCESKYDNYRLGTLSNLVCEAKYTDFRIDRLNKKLDLVSQYGDFAVGKVPGNFEKINVENKYGKVNIGIDGDASYHLKGKAEYARIGFPASDGVSRIEKNTEMNVSGRIGKDENTQSEVNITTKYGNVDLK
ncbi:MAG: hypothetical protein ACLFM7_11185 [Bacteroidales bacterium]